ncbi:MAG: branched-chain amino acid ABC transporter permease [Candidatus Dormibacteria bacterium]
MSERARVIRRILLAVGGVILVVSVVVPLTSTDTAQSWGFPLLTDKLWFRVATTVAMFVVLASAWNIIGGMTGYAAFGNVAFFGVGAYSTAFLVANRHLPFALGLLTSPLVAAVFAIVIGVPLLRLRGHYFAIATLGVSVAVGEVVNNIEPLGGSTGIFLPIVRSDLLFFYLMAATAVLAVAVAWFVLRTRFGYGLLAIRENEEAAAVIGINTTLYKVGAFALAAALTGLAGGIFAQWNVFINAENVFPVDYNVQMILMAVLGGSGTVLGPVIGAVALEALIQAFASGGEFAVLSQVGLGVLLAATVIFVPRGILDFLGGQSRLTVQYLRNSLRRTSV